LRFGEDGELKEELLSDLRSKRSMRRSEPVDPDGDRREHIKDIVSIRQRPAAVEDRAVPGHREGDVPGFKWPPSPCAELPPASRSNVCDRILV
jgi:IS30 family transposase